MLGTLSYPPDDIKPISLTTYNTKHHSKYGFCNDPNEPLHNPSSMLDFGLIKSFFKKSDVTTSLEVVNPINTFVNNNKIRCYWLGHACCLIQFNDIYVLTDPVFSESASPVKFIVRRATPIPCEIEDLPKISVVLLSHDHWDHFDLSTLKRIVNHSPECVVFAPLVLADLVNVLGIKCVSFDWRQHVVYNNIDFTCMPARHMSSRIGIDWSNRLWCSWIININNGHSIIYYPGDTAIGPHFKEVYDFIASSVDTASNEPRRIDLTLMPIGPQEPHQIMRVFHVDPKEAFDMQQKLKVIPSK